MRTIAIALLLAACNGPPEGGVVTIAPTAPTTTDDLVASIDEDAVDPNGKDVTYAWSWTVDGSPVDDVTTETVPAAMTSKGQNWEVTVVPSDGKKTGEAFTAGITIANTGPAVSNVSIAPGDVTIEGSLTVSFDTTDADDDPVDTTISWTVGGTEVGDQTTLSAAGLSKGDQVSVTVTPTDGEAEGESMTAGPVTILNTPPTAASASISPSDPLTSDALLCALATGSTDVDGDTLSYTATWTVDGAPWTGITATTTHTDDTIPAGTLAHDQEWTCSLAVDDGEATTPGAASAPVTVTSDRVTFRAGYYWVIADYAAPEEDHDAVCAAVGLVATETLVALTWTEALLGELSEDFGYTSAGDTSCCAEAMWCWDGSASPTSAPDGSCETHNFGTQYWNYGTYSTNPAERPVFTCTR